MSIPRQPPCFHAAPSTRTCSVIWKNSSRAYWSPFGSETAPPCSRLTIAQASSRRSLVRTAAVKNRPLSQSIAATYANAVILESKVHTVPAPGVAGWTKRLEIAIGRPDWWNSRFQHPPTQQWHSPERSRSHAGRRGILGHLAALHFRLAMVGRCRRERAMDEAVSSGGSFCQGTIVTHDGCRPSGHCLPPRVSSRVLTYFSLIYRDQHHHHSNAPSRDEA